MQLSVIVSAIALAARTLAAPGHGSYLENNLAYRSPSLRVRDLEIPLEHVTRKLAKRGSTSSYFTGNLTFPWSVASGDPEEDSVVLWTKPRKLDLEGLYGSNDYPPVCLQWQVSKDGNFTKSSVVASGKVTTSYEVDYSTKVIASGLEPYTKYSYQFKSCAGAAYGNSTIGTFKTLPAANSTVDKIKLAFFSCSNLPFGYFNAYGNVANNSDSIDYVQHLGDYIYEYKDGDYGNGAALNRVHQPDREISTLEDYRQRYAQYRMDPDLMALHTKVAWQTVWDDHEVADQAYKAGTADSNDTASGQIHGVKFTQRKANAVRAYYEWLPIRQVDTDDKLRIYRSFKVGKLFDMIMLDTRQYDRDITDLYYNTDYIESISDDADRSIMGAKQQSWFFRQLSNSKARGAKWRLIMQQVGFAPLTLEALGAPADYDAWEGYKANRRRVLNYVQKNKIENFIVLSGDSHASWVNDLTFDNKTSYDATSGEGAFGVEFAGSAVSSPSSYGYGKGQGPDYYVGIAKNLTATNPNLQYAEGQLRGYVELTVTPDNVQADYIGFEDQMSRSGPTPMASFFVDSGAGHLRRPLNGGNAVQFGYLGAGAQNGTSS